MLHAVGHFADVRVANGVHDQSLDLDVWDLKKKCFLANDCLVYYTTVKTETGLQF